MIKPVVLIILDGFGIGAQNAGNAIYIASTPTFDKLLSTYPNTYLAASGEDVGLPDGQIGNSEVGHTNIGAGRVVFQDLPRISNAIKDGSFFENRAYIDAMDAALRNGTALHLLGLLSDGGVHSHNTHLWALLKMAKSRGLTKIYIHAFLDGRDVPPKSGKAFVEECVEKCAEIGVGKIAAVMGRYYAMDRDKRWERVERAYDAIVSGNAPVCSDPAAAVEKSYDAGVTDEFMEPVVCDPSGTINNGDSVIFFNFRPDRAREMTYALTMPDFTGFERGTVPTGLNYVCTTQYDELLTLPIAFSTDELHGTFGDYVSSLGLTQLRIAETEKYAHVTFFFNGGVEHPCIGEDRVLIPSPKQFPTYDLIPQMSAIEVTEEVLRRLDDYDYDVIIINYANCDMVGHTGVLDAAVSAVQTVDACVGRVVDAVLAKNGVCLVTSDHGNADRMLEYDNTPYTAHTVNPVPFIITDHNVILRAGKLADIAPTMLDLMGIGQPSEMTGHTLIVKDQN